MAATTNISPTIRIFDITISLIGLIATLPILLIVTFIGFIDSGSPIFIQERIGRKKSPFKLIKFRTMKAGTASLATHLVDQNTVTPFGKLLRKTKIDELPQLINVFFGQMSLVGPRPGLNNQIELTSERDKRHIFTAKPGITGLGQVNQIDMSTPKKLALYDSIMLKKFSLALYFQLIIATALGKGAGDKIK
ncbi:MAG: sugar transferase [Cellvibrionaceae bacterium]